MKGPGKTVSMAAAFLAVMTTVFIVWATPSKIVQVKPKPLPQVKAGKEISLAEALSLAEKRNLSLAAVRTEIDRANAELELAWSTLLPIASGNMTYTHADHEDSTTYGTTKMVTRKQDTLHGGVSASVPLISPQTWAGVKVGKIGVEIATLTVEQTRQHLLLSVALSYYQALTARAIIDVEENLYHTAARHYEIALMRHTSGVGRRLDVIRAKSEMVRVRQELLGAHSALDNSRDALGILTGMEGLPLPLDDQDIKVPVEETDKMVARATERREDIAIQRQIVSLSERRLSASWMQFLPSLNASWQLTHQFTSPSDIGSDDRTRWNAFLTLSVPIYNQTRYADLDHNRAALKRAQLEAADAEQKARLEVRKNRRDYQTSVEQLETAREQAALSDEALTLAETAYVTGTASSLEVTDAARTSRQDQVNLAIKRFEVQLALVSLLRAVGEDMSKILGAETR
jgi:outer membrane protein TolC